MVTSFVEGWDFVQTLGEGAFGEVKLAVNSTTQEAVAVKIINCEEKKVSETVRKEVCVHRIVDHENVIKFYGKRREGNFEYLFLEYASGGELFDRIEPDVGMPQQEAQRYFKQLLAGVDYLHVHGITHRDLKPENLLLDDADNLKISDFGFATWFRFKGRTRQIDKCCGTVPYVAPEVIQQVPYDAEPADLWSCAIILITLLAGELPWNEPTYACEEYCNYRDSKLNQSPWSKMDSLVLGLLHGLLKEKPNGRYTVEQIKKSKWYCKNFSKKATLRHRSSSPCQSPTSSGRFKRICSRRELSPTNYNCARYHDGISASQPMSHRTELGQSENSIQGIDDLIHGVSFSQPDRKADDLLVCSQLATQCSQTPMQKLVRRMTRFFVKMKADSTLKQLKITTEKLGYEFRSTGGQVTVVTSDCRHNPLIFKAFLMEMSGDILVDFRLSKGDGLEFKRCFVKIKKDMQKIIKKAPPLWPMTATPVMENAH